MQTQPSTLWIRLAAALVTGCLLLASCTSRGQRADPTYVPNSVPAIAASDVTVWIDEGHENFHTRSGRYAPFAAELEAGGLSVASSTAKFSAESLDAFSILVIANALSPESSGEWVSPTPSAFDPAEVEALAQWVADGGRLLLIADHMPFPGAAEKLAQALGFRFHNGFAFEDDSEEGNFILTRDDGLLLPGPLKAFASRPLREVKVFTGQAFGLVADDVTAVLLPPPGTRVLLPSVAWEFDDSTEEIATDGLAMGALRRLGEGRVAVFGEAAMFTSQVATRDGQEIRMGLADPEAADNAAFLHAVMSWLAEGL